MLPKKLEIGVALGLLLALCANNGFVNAGHDLDLNGRVSCLDGSDGAGANCNVLALPAEQLSCLYCSDADCEDFDSRECATALNEQDQCYMRFDETNSVVQMGCVSDFGGEEAVLNAIKQKELFVCDGNDCNSYANIPKANECTICSSDSLEACATKPATQIVSERCRKLPYTQCYQRVNAANGNTERGCLSNLSGDDFYNCLTNVDSKCKVCTGDACNEEIIPADRPKCQRCNSDSESACHILPAALSICPKYSAEESCVSLYENGVTKRGCLSELSCDSNAINCQICKGDGCNTINIKKRVDDGVYGAFQELPLNCNTCTGAECLSGVRNARKCEGDRYQDCLTVFNEDGVVVRRGCEALIEAEYVSHCDAHPELCFNCKSNGCNDVTDATTFTECLYCDAASNPDCLFNPTAITTTRKCVEGCIASLYKRKSYPGVFDFVRTCLEDIESDDRDACTADANCVKCEGAKGCNVDILPVDGRLSCLHCDGPDCHLPVSKACVGFAENDQCYMYFDDITNSTVRMGCKSAVIPTQLTAEIKQFFLCDGENCNDYVNLPEANLCFTCDSATNENCASDPSKLSAQVRCQTLPYTQCVTRVRSDGHTERGCLHSIPTDDFVKCSNGDGLCDTCTESDCNKAVFPADRQQCYRCSSESDANCEAAPTAGTACPHYKPEDSCVTKLINGKTHRGCSSELDCDGANHKSCRSCTGTNCNTIDLVADSIGDPGLFQTLPLNCYHCDGSEECDVSLGRVKKCEGNNLQTCTSVFATNGSVIARGCSDAVDTLCAIDDNNCYDCKSSGCNLARQQSDYIDCVFCDAQNGDECALDVNAVTRTRKCHKACITALYPRTEDSSPVYELLRTCLDDMDLDDREDCLAGKNDNCKACTSNSCNKDDLGTRQSCYHCSGENCQDPQVRTCRATAENDQCFIEYDETSSIVEMGCKSKYDPAEVKILTVAKRLWLCDQENCNTFENLPVSQRCALCNSRTDAACAIAPSNVESTTACSRLPHTECYSRILEGGYTERGCLSSLEDEQFYSCLNKLNTTECSSCTGENCNVEVHPNERRSCHVCRSDSNAACEVSPQSQQTCLLYTSSERCVAFVDANGITARGCSSQLACDASDSAACQVCAGDNCNSANLKRKADGNPGIWQELPLTCRSCDSEDNCKTDIAEETCTGAQYCMTVFNENGAVIMRGCSDTVEAEQSNYCDINSQNCHNCNSANCNTAMSLNDYNECIYCDSRSNANCASNPAAVSSKRKCNQQCMTALYPRAGSSAYDLTRTCLDDKNIDDQQECQAGRDERCIACEGASCNTDILSDNLLSCYVCQGDGCEDPSTAECETHSENDQCFMLFDQQSNVVQLGCVRDMDDSFVANNIHLLHLCSDGDNCNGFENMPTPQVCAVCNSNTDTRCATEPQQITTVSQCTTLPITQCYARVNTDGSTERGCASSLTNTQMQSCLNGNATTCTACHGERCNTEIYPADRRRCQRCNTEDDPSCESSPNAASVCPYYSANEFCATKLVYGDTYRGCSSEFQCDDTDKQYCRLCHGADNCNVVDLAITDIGYPGKWQDVPINCYTCFGVECHGDSLGQVRICDNTNLQNCATVFAANGTVVQRGCSDEVYANEFAQYCDENPASCKYCKSSECNTPRSLTDFVDCVYCDGVDNTDCIFNVNQVTRTRTCHKKCVTGLYPRTNEANPAYELARGCLDDLESDDRESCENGNKAYCTACEGTACNKVSIPETRHKCYVCNGVDCEDPSIQECSAFRENEQCFTLFDNSTNSVQRLGCVSDLEASFVASNRRQLLVCNDEICNDFSSLPSGVSCSVCNSIDDPNCAVLPGRPSVAAACQDLPYTQCYTHVDTAGVTHRGCLSDVADDLFEDCLTGNSETCSVCASNNCNTQVYPAGRRSCNRCDSANDNTCEESASQYGSICPVYNAADTCVTKIESQRLLRGCSSDFTCDASDRGTCRVCENDNCNTVNLLPGYIGEPGKWQSLPLNCHVCEGAECATPSGSSIHKCEGNNRQTCVTVFAADGTVEKRGCSDFVVETHDDYCDENSDRCIACKSNGCNNAVSLNDFVDCYFCDSAENGACAVNFDTSTRTRKCQKGCMVALYPRSSSIDPAYELSRSCLDDMDIDEREACTAGNNEYCKACEGSRCNTVSVPEERHECYKCVGDDCEDVEIHQCSAHHPNDQCYVLFDKQNSIAAMGCRSEFEIEAVTELIKQKQLVLCDGKNCNRLETLPTPKVCSVCNSDSDPRCATNPNLVGVSERCSSLPYTECFTRVNENGHTVRGCISSLESETFYGCLTNSDGLCETCTGNKCNEIDVFPANRFKCHQCNSLNDPLCGTAPDSNNVCPVYSAQDSCVTSLSDGVTIRGCSSNLQCHDPSDSRNCRVCNTAGCNTVNLNEVSEDGEPGRWQAVPLTCYTCKDEDCVGSLGIFRVCQNNLYQNCMTVFNAAGVVTQRGCSDDVEAANQQYCDSTTGKCLKCNSHGCNSATSLDDYVECLACDTDANGDCVNNVNGITKSRLCHKNCMTALYPREKEDNPAYGLSRSCYDDMDLDDREACAAGTKEYCQTCSGPKCNTVAIPEQRLSCYLCDGDDCQDPQASSCPTYREGDKCYIRYDEQRSIVAMGCRSEFSNADADYLLKQKRLFLCEEDNCNTFDALPTAQTCVLCNSRTDAKCSVNPDSGISTTTCSVLPFTECYSRVLSDGATERGCLSNLYDDEFLGCLNGTSSSCEACKGNSCNNKVYPSERASCHICNSATDPGCEGNPNSISICPKYDAEDKCVTSFRNGITYRGCTSSLTCDSSNPRACAQCTGNGCNTVNLAKKQDDNFGKWQDLPLRCLTCSGDDCNSAATTQTLTCENNNEQDCVTVFDVSGKVVRRGCSDAVEEEYEAYCDQNDDNCYNCKSNECNTATAKAQFVDCVYCDTHDDLNCLWNPLSDEHKTRKCQGACMTALYPSDASASPAYDLIRTCLNDKETTDQSTCSADVDATCKACLNGKCNVVDLPEDRFHCLICEGDECEDPVSKACPLHRETDQCFTWFDDANSVTQMGCISSFRNQDLEAIIKTKRVFVCDGENCNTFDKLPTAQRCAACDSKNNVFCATNANAVGTFDTCNQMPYTNCYSKLENDGTTVRGCLADLPVDNFAACVLGNDENCGVCSQDGCNREVFPANRQQCHTCSSDDDSTCESFPTRKQACPIVSTSESCITALSGNVTYRGCSSDLFCDSEDVFTCRSCFGTSCNGIDLRNKVDDGYHGIWQDLPLRCHTCEGDHCLSSLGPAVTCSSKNVNQDCMTVFNATGEVQRRGCSDDVDDYEDLYCRQNPELCFKCKSNECNSAWELSDYVECAFCDSTTDDSCAVNPDSSTFAKRICNKECMVAMKDSEVVRSCLDDKEIFVQYVCRTGTNGRECSSCEGDSCNNFIFPADRLKCHVCTGSSCSSSVGQYCRLYDENDFCFAKYENGQVDLMGCGSAQNASDIDDWTAQKKLYRCEGNECNDLTKLPTGGVCVSCDSSVTPNCAQSPTEVTTSETCDVLSNECVTRINDAGRTLRGCFSKLDQNEQNTCVAAGNCAVCSGDKCNNNIYPANRRVCHICNSVASPECAKEPNASKVCPIYAANDRCVSKNTDNYIERGCESSLTCDINDRDRCQICEGNSCNTADITDSAAFAASSLMLTLLLATLAILGVNRH